MQPGTGGQYYSEKLFAERLKLCYDLAPAAVRHYLAAEVAHARARIAPGFRVLELGCGYGRVLEELAQVAATVVGLDTSVASLVLARSGNARCQLVGMNAARLAFAESVFDVVCCLQNGISAFHEDQQTLIQEAVRVVRPGGTVLFSSYAEEFWEARLHWFRLQAAHGLVGEIDDRATGNGVIVGKDGFAATTVSSDRFRTLARGLGQSSTITVVAGSSLFCEIRV